MRIQSLFFESSITGSIKKEKKRKKNLLVLSRRSSEDNDHSHTSQKEARLTTK